MIGSNNDQSRFRVLKIDRSEPKKLVVVEDKKEYQQQEIKKFVNNIEAGNQNFIDPNGGLKVSAFGLIGFVRFLEGYYIILITKRRRVAVIGNHTIYKIEDTTTIYIPNDSVRYFHPDEQKYLKMFHSIDLSSNFYFSYSFDITHTLQYNLVLPRNVRSPQSNPDRICGVRNKPHERFVWNMHLLSPVGQNLHCDWILYVIHGFIGQSNVSVFGRPVYITLIARRSNKYAGTRFLKRGANFSGDVANEVETEQIVNDARAFSSFVQMRGSVPGLWSQDISKMVPKPSIAIDLSDPFSEIAGAHLNQLLNRYGSPIIILNLVKKREHKKHESILSEEINTAVKYLNQFLPPEHHIQYLSFDMARKNKGKLANVMGKLATIAINAVTKTKIFLSLPKENKQKNSKPIFSQHQSLQTGIIRTNCVDCLDRTNTAQFAIGKCALGFQLCALGILESPNLEFDSDCVRMLEELYEDHGDTLALQYGGSQLVHRIKSYRKTAPWTSQGNDIMQTLSRYYSNTFSDQEKQHTINLFLGLFTPTEGKFAIWDMITDYYLHYKSHRRNSEKTKLLTQWWDENLLECLPYSVFETSKTCLELKNVARADNEIVDAYYDYYRPFELSLLTNAYAYQVSHSTRDFMPHFTTNFSPFVVRVRPGKRREETTKKNSSVKNPSLTGQSSTSSTTSSASSSGDSSSDDESQHVTETQEIAKVLNDSTSDWYSCEAEDYCDLKPKQPKRSNISLYKKFLTINEILKPRIPNSKSSVTCSINSTNEIKPFEINKPNVCAYEKYLSADQLENSFLDSPLNTVAYENYVYRQKLHFDDFCPNFS